MMPDDYPARLHAQAQAHWVEHLAEAEDNGTEAQHATNVLTTAAAYAEAHLIAWGEEGPIPDEWVRDVVDSFEASFLKTLADLSGDRLSEAMRGRMAQLDRDLKRKRGIGIGGGIA
jgi:hypothetical protein